MVEGLRTFRPDAEHNPGRMNLFTVPLGGRGGERRPSSSTWPTTRPGSRRCSRSWPAYALPAPGCCSASGAVGDRTDDLLGRLGEIGAMGADVVAIAHKERYLRGRTLDELDGLLRDGAERVGVTDVTSYDTEVDCLAGLVAAGAAR